MARRVPAVAPHFFVSHRVVRHSMPARVTLRRKSRNAQESEAQETRDAAEDVIMETRPQDASDENRTEAEAGPSTGVEEPTDADKRNFVLVIDNGQLALVSAAKSHLYRSLPERGEKVEYESGSSTPAYKIKKRARSHLSGLDAPSPRVIVKPMKRGRGRPPKKRSRSRMLEFELEEEVEVEEEYEEEGDGEDGEEEDGEGEAAGTPADELVEIAMGEDDDIVPPPIEQNVYVQGKDYLLKNDELVLDVDADGESKIDDKGNLIGSREFNFRTFTSPYRFDKEVQYALSIDVARGAGYRDSLLFFRRNPLLIKLNCTDREKVMLIEQGRLSGQLRTRNITMLAVRNAFKLFGAKVIRDGRFIVDDYYEQEAREAGRKEAIAAQEAQKEVPAPSAPRAVERRRDLDRDRQKRRPDAFTFSTSDMQGNTIYTTFGDTGQSPFERARGWNARKVNLQRAELDDENWMMEMAQSVRGMNHEILVSRNERLKAFPRPYEAIEEVDNSRGGGEENGVQKGVSESLPIGFFEPLTNVPHYSSLTQPQTASLERVHERPLLGKGSEATEGPAILGNAKVGSQGWGLASFDHLVVLPAPRAKGIFLPAGESAQEEEG